MKNEQKINILGLNFIREDQKLVAGLPSAALTLTQFDR